MKSPQIVRMPDDGAPVWTRSKKSRGNPILTFLLTIMALVGALTLVLAAIDRSFSAGGARLDGWIASAVSQISPPKATPAMDQAKPVPPASAPAATPSAPVAKP